ncbi:Lrp/AsnC ligand binding domain-containing protein [Rhodococcus sp. NPDC004095]
MRTGRRQQLREVVSVELVIGRWDLVVRLRVRDHVHLKEVLTASIWQPPTLGHSESMVVPERDAGHLPQWATEPDEGSRGHDGAPAE